jgi:hypothetical protein
MPDTSYQAFELAARAVAAIFSLSGIVQLMAPPFVRRAYEKWQLPPKFYFVIGGCDLLAAFFLILQPTRIWGVALAGAITFSAVIVLLNHRQYVYSGLGILILVALVPAARTAF